MISAAWDGYQSWELKCEARRWVLISLGSIFFPLVFFHFCLSLPRGISAPSLPSLSTIIISSAFLSIFFFLSLSRFPFLVDGPIFAPTVPDSTWTQSSGFQNQSATLILILRKEFDWSLVSQRISWSWLTAHPGLISHNGEWMRNMMCVRWGWSNQQLWAK